jgi:hypothetical protein
MLDFLVAEIQNIWGEKLGEMPAFEILPCENYLSRINELVREANNRFGYGGLCNPPPTMISFPDHGILIMPEKFIAQKAKRSSTDATSADFDIMEFVWDRPFFEEVLYEELCHALFRQLRGEWKADYVRSMKAVGNDNEQRIRSINESAAQYAKEIITQNIRPIWGLYVAAEKIYIAWQNRLGMNDYLGIDALSANRKLSQVTMVDDINIKDRHNVLVSFDPHHTSYTTKKQIFYDSPAI